MATKPKWYQLRLVTCIILMLETCILVGLNLYLWDNSSVQVLSPTPDNKVHFLLDPKYTNGFPMTIAFISGIPDGPVYCMIETNGKSLPNIQMSLSEAEVLYPEMKRFRNLNRHEIGNFLRADMFPTVNYIALLINALMAIGILLLSTVVIEWLLRSKAKKL